MCELCEIKERELQVVVQQMFRKDITPLTASPAVKPQDIPDWHLLACMIMKHGTRIDTFIDPDRKRWRVQGWAFPARTTRAHRDPDWSMRWFEGDQVWSIWRAHLPGQHLDKRYRCADIPAYSALGQAILEVWCEQSAENS
jgi:hypothetical protein